MASLERKTAVPLRNALKLFLIQNRLSAGHNTYRIFEAWDKASGASPYVTRKFFRDGTLYVTTNSSMARSHLQMQLPSILAKVNGILSEDGTFIREDSSVGFVKKIVLK